jgi:hypothetical protein
MTANALGGLMKWACRGDWREALNDVLDRDIGPACRLAGVSREALPKLLEDHCFATLWGCMVEDLIAQQRDDGLNIVDDYLRRRGWKEGASNKAYMAALRSSVMSLYEVSDIVRNDSFLARDLVRGGEPVRVSEVSGTRYLRPWDRIAARLVEVGQRRQMAGGMLPLDYAASESVLDAIRRLRHDMRTELRTSAAKAGDAEANARFAAAVSDTEILRSSTFLFTNAWLVDLLGRILHPKLQQLRNADGDDIVFTSVRYPLAPDTSAEAIRRALDSIPALRAEGETFWNWIGPQRPAVAGATRGGIAFTTTTADGSAVYGTLELTDNVLVLEANSRQRAERGRALIEPILGQLLGEPQLVVKTVEELRASQPADKPKASSPRLPPDQERALVRAHLQRHFEGLLDSPVPMLGDIAPVDAAKTTDGRKKLVAWLKMLENGMAGHDPDSPMGGIDLSWMWGRLGIAELRR